MTEWTLLALVVAAPPLAVAPAPVLADAPVVVGADAAPVKARPWAMTWADVYRKVKAGATVRVVVRGDAAGAVRVDDGPAVGTKFTDEDGDEFVIEAGATYVCFPHNGVPSFRPETKVRRLAAAARHPAQAAGVVLTRAGDALLNCAGGS